MFNFNPESFNYEAVAQSAELAGEKASFSFPKDKQTAVHIIPLTSSEVGTEIWQFNQGGISNIFGRTLLSCLSTKKFNPFLGKALVEKGFTNYTIEDGVPVFKNDPVEELVSLLNLENPEYKGKVTALTRKSVGYYIIVPYATRSIPTKVKGVMTNPAWEAMAVVKAYWILGKDGKAANPHLRPQINKAIAESRGAVCNIKGDQFFAVSRTGEGIDSTAYFSCVLTKEDMGDQVFERPSVEDLMATLKSQWPDLQPEVALDFMIPTPLELERPVKLAGLTFKTLHKVGNQETRSQSTSEQSFQLPDLSAEFA